MWLAWVLKETDPQSSHCSHHKPWASAGSQESGARKRSRPGSRSPNDHLAAGLGPEPGPQAPPSIQNQICWSGEEGEQVSNLGLHWAQRDCFLQSPYLPCARLQPLASLADEENLVPASTNMCAFWNEAAAQAPAQWVDLKAQREVTG